MDRLVLQHLGDLGWQITHRLKPNPILKSSSSDLNWRDIHQLPMSIVADQPEGYWHALLYLLRDQFLCEVPPRIPTTDRILQNQRSSFDRGCITECPAIVHK